MPTDHTMQLRSVTKLFFLTTAILAVVGCLFVYSSSSAYAIARYGNAHYFINHHLIHLIFGLFLGLCCALISPHHIRRYTPHLCVLALFGMLITRLTSIAIHGAHRWLYIAGISLQVSEFLPPIIILFAASFLASSSRTLTSHIRPFLIFAATCLLAILLLLLQPDFGGAVTLFLTIFLLFATLLLSWRQMLISSLISALVVGLLIIIAPYRMRRIAIFLNPWQDPKGKGFQVIQSLIAIGAGHFWGAGIGQSQQKFFYLPMQHTDFIFSVIAEETGFLGAFLLILLFAAFFYLGFRLSLLLTDEFASYTTLSFITLLALKTSFNMMVASALAPTKGVGLPLISYGGSSLLATCVMLGVILSFVRAELRTV
jgi:cell division protein FtsW